MRKVKTCSDQTWTDAQADPSLRWVESPIHCYFHTAAQICIFRNAYSGTAQGPVVLNGINCDGSETSILQCPSKGWMRVSSTCGHSRDAGVFCYKHG